MTAAERLRNDPRSELWGEHRARYRFACQLISSGSRVLDVACGAGLGLEMLLRTGARPVGVDLDPAALADARLTAPRATLVRADAARLPLSDQAIDVVVSFETIEHVADPAALAAELRRILRPGGCLVLSTPNRDFGAPARHSSNPFHVREFSGDELRDLLLGAFDRVQLYGQWVSTTYRYVPFLLVERTWEPAAVAWKVLNRLPFRVKDAVARRLTGHPFLPGEADYLFAPDEWRNAHALVAIAR
jgi:SAM-dependent methyltransferase